jgi:hypothetical protein
MILFTSIWNRNTSLSTSIFFARGWLILYRCGWITHRRAKHLWIKLQLIFCLLDLNGSMSPLCIWFFSRNISTFIAKIYDRERKREQIWKRKILTLISQVLKVSLPHLTQWIFSDFYFFLHIRALKITIVTV